MNTPLTWAYAAKRAIIAAVAEHVKAQAEGPLQDATVDYAYSATTSAMVYIYGGGVVFSQPAEDEIQDGRNRLVEETASIGLHVKARISPTPDGSDGGLAGVAATDELVERIGTEIAAALLAKRELVPGVATIVRISGGRGDYNTDPDGPVSTLSIRVDVLSNIQRRMLWR